MKTIGIILLIAIGLLGGLFFYVVYRFRHLKDNKNLEASIDKQAQNYIKKGKAIGLVIGVYKDGQTWIKGYGSTQKEGNILPDSNSIFELASSSKLFTTSCLQLLADEGILGLDDKISSLLPQDMPIGASAQNTTLRHLATHLSGFPSLPDAFMAKMQDASNPYKDLVTQDIYDYLANCEGKKEDGSFEYSNFGMGLLGHLIALRTGTSYEALVKQKLLQPLHMEHTFVSIDSLHKASIVQGYDENGEPAPIWTDNVLTGAGSFLSNASDMMKFIKANLHENENAVSASLLRTQQQQLEGTTGLGWILASGTDKLIGNKDILWHNGMAGAYASFIAIDKVNNYGLVILSNQAIDLSSLGMVLATTVRSHSWKQQQ